MPPTSPALLVAIACLFAAAVVAVWVVLYTPGRADTVTARIEEAEQYRLQTDSARTDANQAQSRVAILATRLVNRAVRVRNLAHLTDTLDHAGLGLAAQEWVIVRICATVVTTAVLLFLFGSLTIAVLLGVVVTHGFSALVLRRKISRRRTAFADQMPDVMQLVATSLRSGFSLGQALSGVVREGTQPAAGEFARALAETRLGVDIETALDKVATRMACPDLTWAVMAIRISREVGGTLSEVLLTTVHTMRERAALKRQVRSLSAEGRLSAYVLGGMPIGIGLWSFMVRREYIKPLYTTTPGFVLLGTATVCMAVGVWWLSRVVKVEA